MRHPLVEVYRRAKRAFGHDKATRILQAFYASRYAPKSPTVDKYAFDESKHPRGQPENAGEFAEVHATIGDSAGEGVHLKLRHGSHIVGPEQQQRGTETATHQPGDSAEPMTSGGAELMEAKKPLWQQDLREAIPESKINDQAAFDEHRKAVEDAIAAGENVPDEVLADYPDIRERLNQEINPNTPERTPEELSQIESSLREGTVWSKQPLPGKSANKVYSIAIEGGGRGIFKPTKGERPGLRKDIPDGTLASREVVAYEVAKIIGLHDLVPVTTMRTLAGKPEVPPQKPGDPQYAEGWGDLNNEPTPATPDEEGSCQEYCEGAETGKEAGEPRAWDGKRDAARAMVFDFIMGNTDRHAGNWMIDKGGKIRLIDNGLILPEKHSGESVIRMGRAQNRLANHYPTLPLDEAKAEWQDKFSQVQEALAKAGISDNAIARAKQRYDIMMQAPNFNEALIGLNDSAE